MTYEITFMTETDSTCGRSFIVGRKALQEA